MMAWADELAYIAASLSYPGCDFVTKVFETFDFIKGPVHGAIVRIDAQVVSRGNSSVRVQVSGSWAVNGQPIFSTHAVMVNAKDGRAIPIPAASLTADEPSPAEPQPKGILTRRRGGAEEDAEEENSSRKNKKSERCSADEPSAAEPQPKGF
jgi:acyl-CoA hydrolase